ISSAPAASARDTAMLRSPSLGSIDGLPGWSGGAHSTRPLGGRTVLDPGNAAHEELLTGDLGWAPKTHVALLGFNYTLRRDLMCSVSVRSAPGQIEVNAAHGAGDATFDGSRKCNVELST